MKILNQQHFNVDFFEFEHEGVKYRLGIGNYKDQDPGCEMFYPESGSDYILVIYDHGWYKFELKEFTHDVGLDYVSEKLKCPRAEAAVIHEFISKIIQAESATIFLAGKEPRKLPF